MKLSELTKSVDLTATDINHIRGALLCKIEDCITEWRNRNMEFVELAETVSSLSDTLNKFRNYPESLQLDHPESSAFDRAE